MLDGTNIVDEMCHLSRYDVLNCCSFKTVLKAGFVASNMLEVAAENLVVNNASSFTAYAQLD